MQRSALVIVAVGVTALTTAATGVAVAGHDGFTDGPFAPHEAGVHFVSEAGITQGCNPERTRYCPAENVTRAQMATFMHRLSGNADGVAPSVDAASIDGYGPEDLLVGVTLTEGPIVDGAGLAECPSGTVVIGGGYAQDEGQAFVPIVDANYFDDQTEADVWLVGLADPQTGALAGSGFAQAVCGVIGSSSAVTQTSTGTATAADARRMIEQRQSR